MLGELCLPSSPLYLPVWDIGTLHRSVNNSNQTGILTNEKPIFICFFTCVSHLWERKSSLIKIKSHFRECEERQTQDTNIGPDFALELEVWLEHTQSVVIVLRTCCSTLCIVQQSLHADSVFLTLELVMWFLLLVLLHHCHVLFPPLLLPELRHELRLVAWASAGLKKEGMSQPLAVTGVKKQRYD